MQFELSFRRVAWVARGARAAEAEVLDRIEELVRPKGGDLADLRLPVRVVVPSRSARLALSSAVVRRTGRTVLGLVVQTLYGTAFEILEQAGEPVRPAGPLVDVLVRRAAREETALRDALDHLVDGYASVRRSVRELLDAGLDAGAAFALADRLEASPGGLTAGEQRRTAALLRAVAATDTALLEAGLDRPSTILGRATELLRSRGDDALPARAVVVHGFDVATGTEAEFLEQLVRHRKATVVLDHPPDPAVPEDVDVGAAICKPLTLRLGRGSGGAQDCSHRFGPPELDAFVAEGRWGEAAELARRLRALLDEGMEPELVGVVVREPASWAAPLRVWFRRLGIPWSGVAGQGPARPSVRWRGLVDLLVRRETLATDTWLDLLARVVEAPPDEDPFAEPVERAVGPVERADLRLAFRALGAARVLHAARAPLRGRLDREGGLPLPVQEGLQQSDGGARGRRRRLSGPLLRGAVRSASQLVAWCQAWPERAELGEYLELVRELLVDILGQPWDGTEVGDAVDELGARLDEGTELHTDEVAILLADALKKVGATPLGGIGGGVQVLSAGEARGRTYEHLFVLGLNRGSFPPPAKTDALLPDSVRAVVRGVLPDLAMRADAFFAERFRFAELLSAAPRVTLSWQSVDSEGKTRAVSPLVERMRWEGSWPGAEGAKASTSVRPGEVRTAADHAWMAGLLGSRDDLAGVLSCAIRESREDLPYAELLPPASDLAASRVAVIEELDPDLSTKSGQALRSRPGPYLGLLGPALDGDPRLRTPFVSLVEDVSRCPWQALLRRLLRVERVPDPLAAVPRADARILGSLVHRILQRVVENHAPRAKTILEAVARGVATPVPWPSRPELIGIARSEAAALLREEGVALPGLAEVLARQVGPRLEVARRLDWKDGEVTALGAELLGTVTLGGRKLHFRADRVDLVGDRVVLTDYKGGKPFGWAASSSARRSKHLDEVTRGKRLQAAAYASADGVPRASGRFLFLKPEVDDGARDVGASGQDLDFRTALDGAVDAALGAIEAGVMFPRLVDCKGEREPRTCSMCEVREACLRGDSGTRGRLVRWSRSLAEAERSGAAEREWEQRFVALWSLPERRWEEPEDDDWEGWA